MDKIICTAGCLVMLFTIAYSIPSSDPPDTFCINRRFGYYSDSSDCHKYILCFGNSTIRFKCGAKQVFVPNLGRCKKQSEQVVCFSDNYNEFEEYEDYENYDYNTDYSPEPEEIAEKPTASHPTREYRNYKCRSPGYSKIRDKCYKVFTETLNWEAAKQRCRGDEKADLAMIKDEHTQRTLRKYCKKASNNLKDYWIGLNNLKNRDQFIWSDRSILLQSDYQHWKKKSKGNLKNLLNCVEISLLSGGRWKNQDCRSENGFICEKAAVKIAGGRSVPIGQKATSRTSSPSSFCGTTTRPGEPAPVVGGITATKLAHPWQASLRSKGEHRCGGSLIDRCWVLTAAHCVDSRISDEENLPTLAVIGDFNFTKLTGDEQYLPISEIIIHPDWEASPVPINDIALILLSDCAVDTNPVCLPSGDNMEFRAEDSCKVAGWGAEHSNSYQFSTVLKEAIIPIIPQDRCEIMYMGEQETVIKPTMFCGGYLEGGIDACQGDSGGPLTCRGISYSRAVQKGIVSWGLGCAQKNKPGIYTRVASYMDWIRNETKIDF